MRGFIALLGFVFILTGATWGCGLLKTGGRVLDDLANLLCIAVTEEQPQQALGGMTPEDWCRVKDNLQPFIDEVLKAKTGAAKKAGFMPDPTPAPDIKDGAVGASVPEEDKTVPPDAS